MSPDVDHRSLAIEYFNGAWDLIDAKSRTAEEDRQMVTLAFASRQHWQQALAKQATGTAENLVVADWQVAHVASLVGLADLALLFAQSAVDGAKAAEVPLWLNASAHEGLARAHATAGDREGYEREARLTRELLDAVADQEDKDLITGQLASIPVL